MSISSAMQSGVSGLLANSTAVERISYNISNADTVGFRRSFAQMITAGSSSLYSSSPATGVATSITHANDTDGSYTSTSVGTNLAVSGNGFFVVSGSPADTSSNNVLTRVGSFDVDDEGYLVNAAGMYLLGFEYNDSGSLGSVDRTSFEDLVAVNVQTQTISGSATSTIRLSGNLPSQQTGTAMPGDPFVSSMEYYTALGEAESVTMSWQPSTTPNQWTLVVSDQTGPLGEVTVDFNDSGALAGTPATYSNATSYVAAPAGFAFDTATGQMTLTLANGTIPQVVQMSMGEPGSFGGLTQFAGDYTSLDVDANGAQSGTLTRVEFESNGDVWGIFDNGERRVLFQVPLATVSNANGLTTNDNSTFSVSLASGSMYLGEAGTGEAGTINSGGVESSNVDIAQELTDLIQRQRAYSSNAKIITTASEMLEETLNLKR